MSRRKAGIGPFIEGRHTSRRGEAGGNRRSGGQRNQDRQPVSHVTSAIEVITGEQMQKRNLKTVAEALRLATGMAVFSNGGQGTLTEVRMRRSNSQQVLVIIDGAIVNSVRSGATTSRS